LSRHRVSRYGAWKIGGKGGNEMYWCGGTSGGAQDPGECADCTVCDQAACAPWCSNFLEDDDQYYYSHQGTNNCYDPFNNYVLARADNSTRVKTFLDVGASTRVEEPLSS